MKLLAYFICPNCGYNNRTQPDYGLLIALSLIGIGLTICKLSTGK